MHRLFPCLLLSALLLAPVVASAQIPGFTLEQTRTLRWFTIPVQHTQASDVVQEMHWSGPPSDSLFTLPEGVEHISAEPKGNTLLVRATPDGFEETKKIVKVLDKAGCTFAPTLTFLPVPAGDTHLHGTGSPTQRQPLDVSLLSTPGGQDAFQAIKNGGATAKTVEMDRFLIFSSLMLTADSPRLRGDGTLTIDFIGGGGWNGPPVEVSGIHRGDVLVARGKLLPSVTLIQVNY